MEHLTIGLIVGIVMGITGAGGALISIPLFLYLVNTSVKEATVLSLLTVILGTAVNLFGQKDKWDLKIVIPLVLFGAIANYATLPLKKNISDFWIAGLLMLIGIYSVWSIWNTSEIKEKDKNKEKESHTGLVKSSLVGIGLGAITTLTGLGGGVLLIPILKKFYHKNFNQALPTSLLTILLISGISFLTQLEKAMHVINHFEVGLIATGSMASYFFLKGLFKKMRKERLDLLRKVLFSVVTFYAVSSVLIKSF